MMKMRVAAIAAALMALSVGLASRACADALSAGTYSVNGEGIREGGFTWEFSSCGPSCLSVDRGTHGQLNRQGNLWTGTTNVGCNTRIDGNALTGSYDCPMAPAIAITLARIS